MSVAAEQKDTELLESQGTVCKCLPCAVIYTVEERQRTEHRSFQCQDKLAEKGDVGARCGGHMV